MDKKMGEHLMTANTQLGRQYRYYVLSGISKEKVTEILNAAKNEVNGFKDDHEIWIEENQKGWQEIGQAFKSMREDLEITKAEMSRKIGCAPSTLTKFEEGKPIQAAKIIENAYKMALELFQLEVS